MTDSSSGQTMDTVFAGAIEIEQKLTELYSQFSKLFAHVQEISGFWQGLYNDEVWHATTLRAVRESLTPEQKLSPCDKGLSDSLMKTQRVFSKVMLGAINTVDDAYELAHDLEYSEVNVIFKVLATEFVPSQERKRFVHSEIAKHQSKLSDFSRNFGDKAWRESIVVQPLSSGHDTLV